EELKINQGIEQPECRKWLNDIVALCLLSKPVPFEKVFICGGGAKMEGLSLELSTILGQTAELLPLPKGLDPYSDVTAYGAALAGKAGMPKLNLEVKKPDTFSIPWKYAIWLLVILALATVNLEFRHYSADKSLNSQIKIYQQAVKSALPSLAKEQPETYQGELENRTNANIENSRRSPEFLLETIARLAKPLSHYPDLEIRNLNLNAESEEPVITISGQSRSVQQTEEFRQSIGDIVNSAEFLENRKGRDNITTFSIEGKLPKP
ncbi:hypothetical protein IJT10_07205, partial [bacterium]|nr:hypothetical protein [bacterium]